MLPSDATYSRPAGSNGSNRSWLYHRRYGDHGGGRWKRVILSRSTSTWKLSSRPVSFWRQFQVGQPLRRVNLFDLVDCPPFQDQSVRNQGIHPITRGLRRCSAPLCSADQSHSDASAIPPVTSFAISRVSPLSATSYRCNRSFPPVFGWCSAIIRRPSNDVKSMPCPPFFL